MPLGQFIIFDGGEGGGKSSLTKRMREDGFDAVFSREPGGTPWGEKLREYITNPKEHPSDPESRIILNTATRFELMKTVVTPTLLAGQNFVLDRSWPSAWAYNWSVELGKPANTLPEFINRFVLQQGIRLPDIFFWLDVDPAVGLERGGKKGAGINEYDAFGLEFHQKIHQAYQDLYEGIKAQVHPALQSIKIFRIDTSKPFDQVYTEVTGLIKGAV